MTYLVLPWWQRPGSWDIPIPFTDAVLPIQPFGVLVAIGVILGMKLAEIRARRLGIRPHVVSDAIIHMLVGGFLGARLLNWLFYFPEAIAEDPMQILRIWEGGLSSYGGFVGAIAGTALWTWRRKLPLLPVGDIMAFAFPIGWLFGRTGCFVVHDHPGSVTTFFLAVDEYEFGYPPFQPRHDLGLYELMWSAACLALFFWLARRPRRQGFFLALKAASSRSRLYFPPWPRRCR